MGISRCHRTQAGRTEFADGQRGSGDCQPRQERVPGQHEPRNSHANERRAGHDRSPSGYRAQCRTARIAGLVKSSADSLLTIINDILDFSKIEAGKLELETIEFNLRDYIALSIKTLAFRAQQKGLELTCDIRPEVPERVVGDLNRLRQIIINLIGNAIKFTEHGEVGHRIAIDSRTPEQLQLHFVVTDSGDGIAVEKQKLIFDALSQADGSTARKFGGTGLGLTISSRLVELMGGKIWVESTFGHGSSFSLYRRSRQRQRSLETVPGLAPAQLAGLRALVVDDSATNRRILGEMLRCFGMRAYAGRERDRRPAAPERGSGAPLP